MRAERYGYSIHICKVKLYKLRDKKEDKSNILYINYIQIAKGILLLLLKKIY